MKIYRFDTYVIPIVSSLFREAGPDHLSELSSSRAKLGNLFHSGSDPNTVGELAELLCRQSLSLMIAENPHGWFGGFREEIIRFGDLVLDAERDGQGEPVPGRYRILGRTEEVKALRRLFGWRVRRHSRDRATAFAELEPERIIDLIRITLPHIEMVEKFGIDSAFGDYVDSEETANRIYELFG